MEDKALRQIETYSKEMKLEGPVTTNHGAPIGENDAILSVGKQGPVLLQDVSFIEEFAHLNRERIPERMVHAKGAGAFGYFEVTHDITKYTAAKVFNTIGKRTKIAARISTVIGGAGSADTVRDPRGFALKFYTEDGIWDLVGNNTPIFFFRDPMFIPSFVHSQKRNPATHLIDPTAIWDLLSLRPETTHQVMYLFGDRGIPNGFRHMNGYGSHAYKFINAQGEAVYCKFHYKTDQGVEHLDVKKACELAGADPDYGLKDLYNAIANGNYPSWTMYVQIMTFEQAEKCPFNPFDLTKIWPHGDYPLMQVGKLVFNQNPTNYFAQVEQLAFCPAHLVPGIDISPDKMLAARLFAYADAQRYRLGANYVQLPVNCPFTPVQNYQRDGPMTIHSQSGAINYHPNSFGGPLSDPRVKKLTPSFKVAGDVDRHDTSGEDDFSQAGILYRKVLDEPARQRLVEHIASSLVLTPEFIQERAVKNFDESFGKRLLAALKLQGKHQSNL